MTGALGGMELLVEAIHGDVASTVWKAAITPFGSDTFVIKDGKIVSHTISLYMAEDRQTLVESGSSLATRPISGDMQAIPTREAPLTT